MDWERAIEHNRAALLRLVAVLFAMAGLGVDKPLVVSRRVRGAVFHVLRPAESALRRLVVVLSLRLSLAARPKSAPPTQPILRGDATRMPVFALIDPRKHFEIGADAKPPVRYAKGPGPRIFFFDGTDPAYEPAQPASVAAPDDMLDAKRLCRRLLAFKNALENLPKQARRLARLRARPDKSLRPMRPGRPPGYRARGRRGIDEILRDCHQIALMALAAPDSS